MGSLQNTSFWSEKYVYDRKLTAQRYLCGGNREGQAGFPAVSMADCDCGSSSCSGSSSCGASCSSCASAE